MVSSSRAADSSSHRSKRSDGEQGKEGISSLPWKLTQLKKQIQASRLVSVKEKIERNRKSLQLHTCHLFDMAADAEAATRSSSRQSETVESMLSVRMGKPLCCLSGWDWANGSGEKEIGHSLEENLTSGSLLFGSGGGHKSTVPLVKFPFVDKISPYTTWMFLDKNQRMADDQSVVGRRRIYYDPDDNEALICSDSDEEIPEQEEERHEFSEGEDQMLWKALQDHGLCQEVLNILCQFIDATHLEIQERFGRLAEENEKQANNSTADDAVCEGPVFLDKTLDAALDSFDNLFCRRCLVFDCRLHGCSQNLVMPNEKQPYVFEVDEVRKPCGDQCYLKRRKGILDVCHDKPDCSARKGTKFKSVTEELDTAVLSESEDSNPSDDNVRDTVSMQICTDEDRSVNFSSGTAEASRTPNAEATFQTEIINLKIHEKTVGKRKTIEHESILEGETEPTETFLVSADKKQKKLTSSDLSLAGENLLHDHPISKADNEDPDSRKHSLNHFQEEAVDAFTEHPSKTDNCFGDHSNAIEDVKDTDMVSMTKDSFSSGKAQTASFWNTMEKDLYLKGIEIFGKNSCLIARNLLSGLKTCLEVSNYMFNNGATIPSRPLSTKSSLDDFGKAGPEYMEQEMPIRTRIFRRRGKSRKLKYTWKSAGHPTIWKRIADGKRQWCKQYAPCGCLTMCGKECSCMQNGTCCEKYCGCSKSCKNRFRGCHCAKSQCRSRQCPCFAAGRECDPDVCRNCWVSCGDGSLGEPPARGDGYQCGNMKLLLKQRQRILLARSDVAGWGAFIKNPVNKNDYLGEYTGELISHKEADKRGKIYDRANSSFLFDLDDQYVLDAYRKGDKLKFANHSSNPNCYAKVMLVAGDHRVGIFAKEHIEASEELFYDYRYGPDQAPAWARKPEGSKRDDSAVSHNRAHKVA
ncbi:histone-lysine N-methyltransferase EZ1 isoform X1 [Typha latifolia]|uniref:histone-lysine N-methyltransferase EZ1 isoform X1 n=2 Tax=Typha latifolia TaxID=4733 RepID=UPI003C2E754B